MSTRLCLEKLNANVSVFIIARKYFFVCALLCHVWITRKKIYVALRDDTERFNFAFNRDTCRSLHALLNLARKCIDVACGGTRSGDDDERLLLV